MTREISSNGWVTEGGNVVLFPVVGFKVDPGIGSACALQFTYFPSEAAARENDIRVTQLVMTLDGIKKLRAGLERAEAALLAHDEGKAN